MCRKIILVSSTIVFLVAFFAMLGSVGACEREIISFGDCWLRIFVSLVVMAPCVLVINAFGGIK